MPRRLLLGAEYALLFFGLPAAMWLGLIRVNPFVVLIPGAALCAIFLALDPTFERRRLWRAEEAPRAARRALRLFVPAALLMTAGVLLLIPGAFLYLPRERPELWAMIMLLYPVLSVYPQNVISRAFVFHRYGQLVGGSRWGVIALSAAAFAWMHIVMDTWIAVAMTAAGGVIFALTYDRTRSVLATSVEHAMYGCFIFTIGLGAWFFTGGKDYRDQLLNGERNASETAPAPEERPEPAGVNRGA